MSCALQNLIVINYISNVINYISNVIDYISNVINYISNVINYISNVIDFHNLFILTYLNYFKLLNLKK